MLGGDELDDYFDMVESQSATEDQGKAKAAAGLGPFGAVLLGHGLAARGFGPHPFWPWAGRTRRS